MKKSSLVQEQNSWRGASKNEEMRILLVYLKLLFGKIQCTTQHHCNSEIPNIKKQDRSIIL